MALYALTVHVSVCVSMCAGERCGPVQCNTRAGSCCSEECRADRYHSSTVQTWGWVLQINTVHLHPSHVKISTHEKLLKNQRERWQTASSSSLSISCSSSTCILLLLFHFFISSFLSVFLFSTTKPAGWFESHVLYQILLRLNYPWVINASVKKNYRI